MSTVQLSNFLAALFLVAGFFLSCPPFSTRLIPMRVKLFLSITLALYLGLSIEHIYKDISSFPVLFLTSAAFGFCIRILFVAFDILGELIANGMGLSFPGQISAISSQSTGPVAALTQITGLFAFIQLDGLENLIFQLQQIAMHSADVFNAQFAGTVTSFLAKSIYTGITISASIWVSLLVGHIGLLLASRLSGGLNLMNSGFAILCSVGIIFIAIFLIQISQKTADFILQTIHSFT